MASFILGAVGALTAATSIFYAPVVQVAEVMGYMRSLDQIYPIHGEGLRLIDNTLNCEDLHVHSPSGQLFAACQSTATRQEWFPPALNFINIGAVGDGSIYVIDPKVSDS
jgi:hypothetical protein